MYLTDLSEAVKKSGLTVHEVSGWESRGHASFKAVEGVVCHHTAGPAAGNYPSLHTVTFGRPGLSGPLCNVGLARDGSVYVVAAGVAWHAGEGSGHGFPTNDANYYTIGIEAESTGKGDWTPEQLDAYPRLVRALADHYGFDVSEVIGHYEWTPRKIDPHGWPGGMNGLRASAKNLTLGDNDVAMKSIKGGSSKPTQLAAGQSRTLVMNGDYVSFVAGPCRATGVVSVYLEEPLKEPVRLEAYTVKKVGAAYQYVTGNGITEYPAGVQHLRYDLAFDIPAGQLLRVRATALGSENPLVLKAGFNLDLRS